MILITLLPLPTHPPIPPHTQLLDEKERQFLTTALRNYTRCLVTGDGYDLRVVFRIVQLWLRRARVGVRWWYQRAGVMAAPPPGLATRQRGAAQASQPAP